MFLLGEKLKAKFSRLQSGSFIRSRDLDCLLNVLSMLETANDIRGKPMYGASKGCMIGIEVKVRIGDKEEPLLKGQ